MREQGAPSRGAVRFSLAITVLMIAVMALGGCSAGERPASGEDTAFDSAPAEEAMSPEEEARRAEAAEALRLQHESAAKQARVDEALAKLDLTQDMRDSFLHGDKPAEFQKYIMLHDTEGDASASSVIDWWDGNGAGVAAHFVVNKDGSIVQAVPLDKIAHHAGFGDAGHNDEFGVVEDGRDDMVGTTPIGSWAPDYGMNANSIGIELVHVGGSGEYPQAQLNALDNLIAYIDEYYGFESPITDHKAWRSGNSDTSPEFAEHLASYISTRHHA